MGKTARPPGDFRAMLAQLVDGWAHYLRRGRHPAIQLAIVAAALYLAAFGGWVLSLEMPVADEQVVVRFRGDGGGPAGAATALVIVATTILVWGMGWSLLGAWREARRRVLVVELRGLRDTGGSSLAAALPRQLRGRREQLLVDLTQGGDGAILDPHRALAQLSTLAVALKHREGGTDRREFAVAFGGLAPVPFTFLAGMLIDDEGEVVVMDWDRYGERWRTLDGVDDGERFEQSGLEAIGPGIAEVVLAVSVSYRVDFDGIKRKLGDLPTVRLELQEGTTEHHWAATKQSALSKQFLTTAIGIANRGVRRIHLVLAAPSSVVFHFGRVYDRRNLPRLVLYQYQRDEDPPFPWGVVMPKSGETLGELET